MRHSDVKVTTGTYAHLVVEDLRQAVAALPASGEPRDVAPVWQAQPDPLKGEAGIPAVTVRIRPLRMERE